MDLSPRYQQEVLWPLVEHYLSPEIRTKLANDIPLTQAEHEVFLRAEEAFVFVSEACKRLPDSGKLATNESMGKMLGDLNRSLKTHITAKTKLPKNVINYFVQNSELDDGLKGLEENSDIRVSGVKLQMREIACTLIDDHDAVPVKAADAVFEYFKGRPEAYDNKLSFRTTVYKHYEISRGCKPTVGQNQVRDLDELREIIPILL